MGLKLQVTGVTVAVAIFAGAALARAEAKMPTFEHIIVIVEENHTSHQIVGSGRAPVFDRLARTYGLATNFYAETHPSEPNYVAMLGGDTFGIADDDAFYCKPGMKAEGCGSSGEKGYVDHTVRRPALTDQMLARGLSWKGYFEDMPEPASRAYIWPSDGAPSPGKPNALYAAKHNGFMSFLSVQQDPRRRERLVGFDRLVIDIARGQLPNFAMIVPNQCNDMHGLIGMSVPWDCQFFNDSGLIRRADAQVGDLVKQIMATAMWKAPGNAAIVITFDENDGQHSGGHPEGCCGSGRDQPGNPGGGWISTIVITNHGPRGVKDATPYNHYSLLRTIEQAFGISTYLGHAADSKQGVVAMTPLFAVKR